MAVRSHADVMPVETAFSVLAVSTLGLWVLSIAVEDRRIDRQRRALRRAAVHDLTTGRALPRQCRRCPRRAAARPALTGTGTLSRPARARSRRGPGHDDPYVGAADDTTPVSTA